MTDPTEYDVDPAALDAADAACEAAVARAHAALDEPVQMYGGAYELHDTGHGIAITTAVVDDVACWTMDAARAAVDLHASIVLAASAPTQMKPPRDETQPPPGWTLRQCRRDGEPAFQFSRQFSYLDYNWEATCYLERELPEALAKLWQEYDREHGYAPQSTAPERTCKAWDPFTTDVDGDWLGPHGPTPPERTEPPQLPEGWTEEPLTEGATRYSHPSGDRVDNAQRGVRDVDTPEEIDDIVSAALRPASERIEPTPDVAGALAVLRSYKDGSGRMRIVPAIDLCKAIAMLEGRA